MSARLSTALPARLLGRHVGGGAEDHAGPSWRTVSVGAVVEPTRQLVHGPIGLGEAEVEHLDRAVRRDLDVRRLEVAVDDALLVRRLERLGDLPRDRQRLVEQESRRCAMRSASVGPSTSSMTSARPDPRRRRSRRCWDG